MSRALRFMHAADLHLDAPFAGVDAADARVRDALVRSTYRALEALVDACIEQAVDFLVVAGDAYDSADKSVRAQLAFQRAMRRLADAGIPAYVAWGNHDPSSGWSAGIELPASVHVFSDSAVERVVWEGDGASCALYGRSFRRRAETADLARGFAREPGDELAIGVLHTNVGGHAGYDDYAPCTLPELLAAGMDYWALGHIHQPEVLADGAAGVAYAGCTQGLDPTQTGRRGAWLVTLAPGGAELAPVDTAAVRWDARVVDLSAASGIADVSAALIAACDDALRDADGTPALLRIDLTGRSDAHAELRRPGALADLLADVRERGMESEPWAWVDRVRDRTRPAVDLAALRAGEDFAGDLVRLADELLADPEQAAGLVRSLIGPLADKVGRDFAEPDPLETIAAARDAALDRLLEEDGR